MKQDPMLTSVRRWLLFFMIALFLSGLTAIPIHLELAHLLEWIPPQTQLHAWLDKVLRAYDDTRARYPFLLYGYDWLAFAHFILAILFYGPYRDPVKNIWVVEFGLIACVLILPLAFIAGPLRGIPIGWLLIDCAFGLFGFVSLWICYTRIKKISRQHHTS